MGVLTICLLVDPQEVCPSAVACSCACEPVGYEEELKLEVSFCSKALWREKVRRGTACKSLSPVTGNSKRMRSSVPTVAFFAALIRVSQALRHNPEAFALIHL